MPTRPHPKSFRRKAFTLIELMVVAAVIAVLLTATMPIVVSLFKSGQGAQSENIVRAALISARYYSAEHRVISGVRFQADGKAVICYATNSDDMVSIDTYTNIPTLNMVAVKHMAPLEIPDPFRVSARDVGKFRYSFTWPNTWKSHPKWLNAAENLDGWFVYPVVLFGPSGKVIQGKCEFKSNPPWYPAINEGSFGRVTDIVYTYQGGDADYYEVTGPTMAFEPMIIDYFDMQGVAQDDIDAALQSMESDSREIYLNINTGMIIRAGDWQSVAGN